MTIIAPPATGSQACPAWCVTDHTSDSHDNLPPDHPAHWDPIHTGQDIYAEFDHVRVQGRITATDPDNPEYEIEFLRGSGQHMDIVVMRLYPDELAALIKTLSELAPTA
jgi:hypothetical protein